LPVVRACRKGLGPRAQAVCGRGVAAGTCPRV
jgi:hypothetical protein